MERWSGRPTNSRHSPFSPFLCPSASSQICTTLLFLFPFLYVQGTVPFSTFTLDYIWWPFEPPQCLAHKRCPLCDQEGRAHALSFSVLCGVTASLAFLVFSFWCFFFFWNIMGIVLCKTYRTTSPSVQPTALHLSISCLTHLLRARLDPSRCLIPKAQLAVPFFTVVHCQPGEENTYIITGTFSTWRFLMGIIHPEIDKIIRTWYWGSTPKEEVVLGTHFPQYRVKGQRAQRFSAHCGRVFILLLLWLLQFLLDTV